MNRITDFLEQTVGITPENQTKILYSIIILLVLGAIRFATLKLVWRFTEDPKSRYTWKRTVSFIIGFLTVILIGSVWIRAIGQFGAFLGLLTAGLAIALKDPLTNIAGWIFLLARKPFVVGDRIQIGDHMGDVIDLRMFQFTLLEIGNWVHADQSTGRIIHVPNAMIFTRAQSNYSAGFKFIWNEIPVLVTFESEWKRAKEILQKIVNHHAESLSADAERKIIEASKKYMIFYQYLTPIVYTSVEES
ncbi:MAG: mechanosensitive ion channel family protein, partial [Bacteroidota bacterium]